MSESMRSLVQRAREHVARHELDSAEPLLRQLVGEGTPWADVYHLLAMVLRERGDFVGAAKQLERAVELNPQYTEALWALAVTYNDLGRYDDARGVQGRLATVPTREDEGLPRDPYVLGKLANLHADLAQAYADARCVDEAIKQLEQAIALRPGFVDLQARLGTYYRDAGRLEDAERHYRAAIAHNPSYLAARIHLGVTLLTMGRTEEAESCFVDALAVDPGSASAKLYLRWVRGRKSNP